MQTPQPAKRLPRLPATPGQSFAPEPDRRARRALQGMTPDRPKVDTIRIKDLMTNRYGVCG